MSEPSPVESARLAADRVADSVAAAPVRGGVAMFALRAALRWALARGSVGAREAARAEGWASRANEGRLRAQRLRHVAWTLVLEDDGSPDAVTRAATVIHAALTRRAGLEEGSNAALLFGTTLVPGPDRFELHRGGGGHVLVGVGAALFAVEVLDGAGAPRGEASIAAALRACLGGTRAQGPSVLAITAAPRSHAAPIWAGIARENPVAARLLREALFSVFLDDAAPSDVDACGRLAQGGPIATRCFWHAMQLVIFRNAKAALVGSFVAGVAADGALDIAAGLGVKRGAPEAALRDGSKTPAPTRLEWKLDAAASKALAALGGGGPVDAGGFVRVAGFGRGAWSAGEVKPSVEGAIVLALRIALVAVAPDLDELECMVGLSHMQRGLVTRVGTTTPEMRALLDAARGGGALPALVAAALAAHRARIRAAKRGESAEVSFELASLVLARLGSLARASVRFFARLVAVLIAVRTPRSARASLPLPVVAVNSSVPRPAGIAGIGRFGVLAPPRSIWIHHSISDDDLSFVLQLGPDHVAAAERLRAAIPAALEQVRAALGATPPEGVATAGAPATRLAYRRLLGLLAALSPPRRLS